MFARLTDVRTMHATAAAYRLCISKAMEVPLHASHNSMLACAQGININHWGVRLAV